MIKWGVPVLGLSFAPQVRLEAYLRAMAVESWNSLGVAPEQASASVLVPGWALTSLWFQA